MNPKKYAKRILSILLVIVIYAIIPLQVYCEDLRKSYDQGILKLNTGAYDEAISIFQSLGEYEDSVLLYLYSKGQKYLSVADFDSAKIEFANLGDYKSSKMYLKYIQGRLLESSGYVVDATKLYNELGSFRDCKERIIDINNQLYSQIYDNAYEAEFDGFYDTAIEGYSNIKEYKDSQNRINYCKSILFEDAMDVFDVGLCWQSWIKLKKISDYDDAMKQINVINKMIQNDEMDSLYPARSQGLYGYIDWSGVFIIEPQWSNASTFSEGLASVEKNEKYGYINKLGNIVNDYEYEIARPFKIGCAIVLFKKNEDLREGILNKNLGKLYSFPFRDFIFLSNFSDERVLFLSVSPKYYGFMNTQAEIVNGDMWEDALSFSEGYAAVMKGGLWGYANKDGNVIIEYSWKDALSFSHGLAPVKSADNEKYGFIDEIGSVIIDPIWDDALPFSEDVAAIMIDQKWGFIDTCNNVVIEPKWDFVESFSEGYAVIKRDDKYGFINDTGYEIIPPIWDMAYSFENGLAKIFKGSLDETGSPNEGLYGYINKNGDVNYMETF